MAVTYIFWPAIKAGIIDYCFPEKQVLYLRGYDFAGSVATGGGEAEGFSTLDTIRFNQTLAKRLAPHACLFKILSPEDARWEIEALEGCFLRCDLDRVVQHAMHPFRSIYLNARTWKRGVLDLLDRMDHFVVYVSSVTESAMWELEQLNTDERRSRVTVVFDAEAIRTKDAILGFQSQMRSEGEKLIWSKEVPAQRLGPEELHAKLSGQFRVISLEEFEKT